LNRHPKKRNFLLKSSLSMPHLESQSVYILKIAPVV